MAGIGFKLRRMVDEGTFAGFLGGYAYSAIISAGPWLVSIATLGTLGWVTGGTSPMFTTAIVYAYSFTLIFVGLFQFTVTRYVSDRLYAGDIRAHIPAFLTTWCVCVIPQALLFNGMMLLLKAPPAFRIQAGCLYAIVATTWVTLVFLGVVRAYRLVIVAFLIGGFASISLATFLARRMPQDVDLGMLIGYTAGQAVTLIILLWVLFAEFRFEGTWDGAVLRYLKLYPYLTAAGLIYYAGMWMDKFVMRFSSRGDLVVPPFMYAAHQYEMADFVAQLTVIPAMAVFFLRVETDFFERFREFFTRIQQKASLPRIEEAQEGMMDAVRVGGGRLVMVQGLITVLAILLTPSLLFQMRLDEHTVHLARIQMVAVYFQTLMFCVCVIFMYYELYREAFLTTVIFLVLNLGLSVAALPLGTLWDGVAFLIAAIVAWAVGYALLRSRLRRVAFLTFNRQPIANLVTLPPERLTNGLPGQYTYLQKNSIQEAP